MTGNNPLDTTGLGSHDAPAMLGENDGAPDEAPREEGPHGITLLDHAHLSAEIAEGARSQATVLAARRITEAAWNEATIFWMSRMDEDVRTHGQDATVPHVYSDAFSKAQDALAPLPPTDAASYARLVVDIQRAGGPSQPLSRRGLSTADYLRLSRHWAAVLSSDPAEARLYADAYQALHAPPAPPAPPDAEG